ncbi:MAG: cellulase family glycosylhydrolase, partial [Chloroflexota bacterium]
MHVEGHWFKDADGRTLILRGANLSGSSKVPTSPDGATHLTDGFFNTRDVSFVGRPFPLEEADEHFARLKYWGLTFLRFQITWEAIEHAGPGIYDEAYLDYLHAVLEKAYDYGIDVFIDPHQDVWSRWTGGDGAPGWTLENIGMDLTKLDATGAAITHQMADEYARMIWLTNFYKFGAATMFTLFFAGDDLAPETKIDGMNPREYLQGHYINAMQRVAQCLADLPNVIGFDTLNEPVRGYIEVEDLTRDEPHGIISLGPSPTPLQAMALAAGHTLSVRNYEMRPWGPSVTGWVELNPDGESLWRDGYPGVWRENDVWTDEGGQPHV